jgi:hypothetical protein
MDPRQWGAAEWGAFGQVGALVVATVAGVLVWLQVRHGRQVREDQTRPYVIVDFEFQGMLVMIAVRNIGTTPAREVRIGFDPPLQSPLEDSPMDFAVFSEGIPMLAPGRAIRLAFGTGPQFFPDEGEGVPLRYEARVQYTNLEGKRYEDPPLILDLLPFKHSAVDREDLHQIYQNLKDIKNLMKSWTSERRLRVNTETQAEVSARHQQWLEDRQAAREAQQEQPEQPSSE